VKVNAVSIEDLNLESFYHLKGVMLTHDLR